MRLSAGGIYQSARNDSGFRQFGQLHFARDGPDPAAGRRGPRQKRNAAAPGRGRPRRRSPRRHRHLPRTHRSHRLARASARPVAHDGLPERSHAHRSDAHSARNFAQAPGPRRAHPRRAAIHRGRHRSFSVFDSARRRRSAGIHVSREWNESRDRHRPRLLARTRESSLAGFRLPDARIQSRSGNAEGRAVSVAHQAARDEPHGAPVESHGQRIPRRSRKRSTRARATSSSRISPRTTTIPTSRASPPKKRLAGAPAPRRFPANSSSPHRTSPLPTLNL